MGNWDYVINSKNTLSGRYFYAQDPSIQPFYQSGVNVPGTPEFATFTNQEAVLKLTTVLTANLVNEARMSYQRNLTDSTTSSPFLSASAVGMTALNAGIGYDVLPRIDIGPLNIGTSIFGTTTNHVDQFQWADQISWTHGKHTIRAGAEVDHNNWNWNFVKGLGAGLVVISSPADLLLGKPGCTPGTFGFAPVPCNPGNAGGHERHVRSATLSLNRTLPPAIRQMRVVTFISGTGLKAPSFRTTSSSRLALRSTWASAGSMTVIRRSVTGRA